MLTHTGTATTVPSALPSFTPTPTGTPLARAVSLPRVRVALRSTATVPLSIDAGPGIGRFDLDIGFDPNVVEFVEARLASSAGQGALAAHIATPGDLVLDGDIVSTVTNAGSLVDLVFRAVGSCRSSSEVVITSCILDGGAVECLPRNGRITVQCEAGGQIKHVNAAPVSDTMVAMYSDAGPPEVAMTDGSGQFAFSDAPGGLLTIEPQKTGDTGHAITAFDAALVLQAVAGLRGFDAMQRLACDVTGDGTLSSLDATRILQLAVGEMNRLPVATTCDSDWAFVPDAPDASNLTVIWPAPAGKPCRPGGIVLDPESEGPPEDFTAVLFGDCSANWTPPAQQSDWMPGPAAVAIGAARRQRGGGWLVPITVRGAPGLEALQAHIAYDPAAVVPTAVRGVGPARDALMRVHVTEPGRAALALASFETLPCGRSPVAVLFFDALNPAARSPRIELLDADIDDVPASIPPLAAD